MMGNDIIREDSSFFDREDNLSSANSNKFFSRVDTLEINVEQPKFD